MMALTSPQTTYPSDLTDAEWRLIQPLLPEDKPKGRHRVTNLRAVVSAIRYRDQFGCPWRMLPDDFPAWGTIYSYYRRWSRAGVLAEIHAVLNRRPESSED
jgi:transposase